MVALAPRGDGIADRIYAAAALARADWRRPHLGASVIGARDCPRYAWLSFRWASDPQFPGRILRLFDRGQREEETFIDALRSIGIEVEEADPEIGGQFRHEWFGGHFALEWAIHF